ncbi:MAG: YkgJ family cysteine cluster protein [Planctomycetes bacterium]|nr:YkgJ family cysteine cluster protein [Planctomycetota bacterium]
MSDAPLDFSDIWEALARELAQTGVQCWQSGACCNFHEFDHDVFATSEELKALVAFKAPNHVGVAEGLCPYWRDRRCTAHQARPLSCRVFHCDHAVQTAHQSDIYEKYLKLIQARIADAGRDYAYVPMVRWLKDFA